MPVNEPQRRPYRSPAREAQAEVTRRQILDAARRLFVERGYATTPLREIAQAAGVSEQTIYAVFGSKTGIVKALVALIGERATGGGGPDAIRAEPDVRVQAALMARFERRLFEGGDDVIVLLRDAGRAEPELAKAYEEARSRARRIHRSLIEPWAERGALRPGLAVDEAADVYGAIASFDVFRTLVRERGWAPERYEAWLARAVGHLLLAPEDP